MDRHIVSPLRRSARYFTLDHWRGVACLMIVVLHSSFYVADDPQSLLTGAGRAVYQTISNFRAGVPVFFVISGYCIAAACDAMRRRDHSVRTYFSRRFRRIFPPYWSMIVIALAFIFVLMAFHRGSLVLSQNSVIFDPYDHSIPNPLKLSVVEWLGNVSLTETWRSTLAGAGSYFDSLFIGVAWTLCYEEQFYAICGLMLFLAPKRFFPIAFLITIGVGVVAAVRWIHPLPIDGFFFDGRWLTFAIGIAVYYRLQWATRRTGALLDLMMAMALIGSAVLFHRRPSQLLQELLIASLFGLVIRMLYRWDGRLNASRMLLPLKWCGLMCYSLYLVHFPIVKLISHSMYLSGVTGPWETLLLTIPLCVAASLLASWVFFMAIERRFMTSQQAIATQQIDVEAKGEAFDGRDTALQPAGQ